jgi:two-component system LytT family response regulator
MDSIIPALMRETMNSVEGRLGPQRFVRIHRSTIVNSERIRQVTPRFSNDYTVLLADGSTLTISRRYRSSLQHVIGRFTWFFRRPSLWVGRS